MVTEIKTWGFSALYINALCIIKELQFSVKLLLLIALFGIGALPSAACTSAIIGAGVSRYGRPMLWKHRDTSTIDNVVEYIPASSEGYGYVALFNADDRKRQQAWIGMNEVGFAVMNTASYNLKDDNVPEKEMDKEGFLMTKALLVCRTVDDFAILLDKLPRPMGVEANFGVIDAEGSGAYFETNNYSFKRYDLSDSPGDLLIRTNYSHSGRQNEGYGFVREANAEHLLAEAVEKKDVTPELLTEVLSRNFYHSLLGKDFAISTQGEGQEEVNTKWVIDQDFIPRYKSTATIVIEGCCPVKDAKEIKPGELKDEYIMWTGLGYPPCTEIRPVWCSPDGVDYELKGIGTDGHSIMSDKVKARRAEVFPYHGQGNGEKYIDMSRLINSHGTGYLQILIPQDLETYQKIRKHRDGDSYK